MSQKAAKVSLRHLWWLFIAPRRLAEFEHEDMKRWSPSPPSQPYNQRALDVRAAVWRSLLKSVASCIGGAAIAVVVAAISDALPASQSMALAILGAVLILFGTLSLGDASTRSLGGTSLIERTNKALYELLLCLGTAFLVAAGIIAIWT